MKRTFLSFFIALVVCSMTLLTCGQPKQEGTAEEAAAEESARQARLELIKEALAVLQRDAPTVWQFFPEEYMLCHEWYLNVKPHQMTYNYMRFRRIDENLRVARQREWNKPVYWPVLLFALLVAAAVIPAGIRKHKRERGL